MIKKKQTVIVSMQYFLKEKTGKISKKPGKETTILKAVKMKHGIHDILEFISDLLPGIISL